jgi:hypothetical protein
MEPTDEYVNDNDDEFDQENFDDIINTRPFPWIRVVIRIFNDVNLHCDHHIKCLSNCYDKKTASCKNLVQALSNMYRLSSSNLAHAGLSVSRSSSSTHRSTTHLKRNDTTSSKTVHDPKKRRVPFDGSCRSVGHIESCLFGENTGINADNIGKTAHANKQTDGPAYGMVFETADPHFETHINTHFTTMATYLEKQVCSR